MTLDKQVFVGRNAPERIVRVVNYTEYRNKYASCKLAHFS